MFYEMTAPYGGVGSSAAGKDKPYKAIAKYAAAVENLSGVQGLLEKAEAARVPSD